MSDLELKRGDVLVKAELLAERDATIAALTKERDLALLSARQMKDAWHAACHDVGALQALVADGRAVVDDFMPYVCDCALQDYRRLNRFLVESEPPSGEPAPSKSQQKRIAAQSGETSAPTGDWLWLQLIAWCRKRGYAPAHMSDLFEIVTRARQEQKL